MIKALRIRKHQKIRKKVLGTVKCPRLAVFRSSKYIYAQVIDDSQGKTLLSISDIKEKGIKKEKAYKIGKELAEKAVKLKITAVVFDRGGFLYQGRIAEVA